MVRGIKKWDVQCWHDSKESLEQICSDIMDNELRSTYSIASRNWLRGTNRERGEAKACVLIFMDKVSHHPCASLHEMVVSISPL